jgi:hypothetical protein
MTTLIHWCRESCLGCLLVAVFQHPGEVVICDER